MDVAKDCLQRALEIDPSNAYVTFALSSFQQRVGNANEAKNILTKLVNTKPTSAVCVSLSEMERKAGNIAKAKQILLDGLERCDEEVSKLYLSLAWLEEDSFHNFDKAVEYLDKALEIEPYNTRVFIARASLAVRNNKVDEARKILQQAAETIPISKGDGQIYTMWSTIELECGNLAKAREVIMRGYQLYPGDHFLLQRWASFESKIGNVEKARELFEKSVLLKPHAPTFVAWAILEENEGVKFYRQSREAAQTTTSFSASTALQVIQNFELSGNNDHTLPVLKEVQEADNSLMNYKQDVEVSVQYSKEEGKVFAEDKFQQARELFMIGMEADPLHGPLYHAYGNMESRRGNTTGARQIFQKGISRKASDYVALYHAWGLLEMKAGNLTLASELFQKGIEDALDHGHLRDIQPKISYLFHSLGMLYLDQRRFQDAYETFQSALVIFPKYSPILLGFAIVNMKMGQFTAAKEYFKRAVDADQFHPHAWQAWAVAEKQLGNIELSRILFREGLKYGASHAALWHGYAVMEMQQGNFDIARYLFAQAIHRSVTSSPTSSSSSIDHLISAALPFNPHAQSYQAWACLELRLGNVQRSKQLVEEGMKVARDHAALWTVAGLVEMKLGNQDFALRILEQGIKRFPKHGALYKVLGELHVKIGNVVEARQIFSLGLEHDPFYAPTYHSAALLEAKIGNLEVSRHC